MTHGGFHDTSGTTAPEIPKGETEGRAENEDRINRNRILCINSGGQWDPVSKTCSFTPIGTEKGITEGLLPPAPEEQSPSVDPTTPETFRDPETGRTSGITLPDGRTFLGLGPGDVEKIAGEQQARAAQPAGTAPVGTAQRQADEQFRIQQQIAQLGQVGILTEVQQAKINKSQAALAGGVGTLAGIATGVIGGALIGGKVGAIAGVPGIAIGVTLGAIGGFITGYISNVKKQQAGEIRAAEIELTSARKIMRGMAELARQDPSRAEDYKNLYNAQLTRVRQARRQLKAEVTGDLNSFMEDGRDNLAKFDIFLTEEAPFYADKIEVALLTGGESDISFTDEQLDEMFGVIE